MHVIVRRCSKPGPMAKAVPFEYLTLHHNRQAINRVFTDRDTEKTELTCNWKGLHI